MHKVVNVEQPRVDRMMERCNRVELKSAEDELQAELKKLFENVYGMSLPKVKKERTSVSGFFKFLSHLNVVSVDSRKPESCMHYVKRGIQR